LEGLDLNNTESIAFLPISLSSPQRCFALDDSEFFKQFRIQSESQSYWDIVMICGRCQSGDFRNEKDSIESWLSRYEPNTPITVNPDVRSLYDSLSDYIFENLPLTRITHMTVVSASGEIPPHLDMPLSQRSEFFNKELEPSLYKVLLNPESYDETLYCVSGRKVSDQEVQPIILPKDTNIFAMSENFHPHGAYYKSGTKRLLVNVYGNIDVVRARQIRQKSLEKYRDFTISFPERPSDLKYGERYCPPL
jgi:hypothetical protein